MGERALDAQDKFTYIVLNVVFRRRQASSISATSPSNEYHTVEVWRGAGYRLEVGEVDGAREGKTPVKDSRRL